jgi:hypothetical protein
LIKLLNDYFLRSKHFIYVVILSFALLFLASSCENAKDSKLQEENDSITAKTLSRFLFLNEWFGKTGVYSYNLKEKKYSPVWWHPRQNVVMLVYRPDNMPAFFLTAEDMGTRGNLPFFEDVRLYRISKDFSESIQLDKVVSGIQFTARWNDDNNLEFIYTSVDKVISYYVNQYTLYYDHYGKLIDSKIETFDFRKSGFPYITPPGNSTLSPSGRYGISVLGDSVFLKTAGDDSLKFITGIKHKINKIKWTDDEKFLFFSTLDLNKEIVKTSAPETSELFIYSLETDSLIGSFGGGGVKNFFTSGDLLIFDDGFGKNSRINIYNLKKQKIVDVIYTKENCGLVFIPEL